MMAFVVVSLIVLALVEMLQLIWLADVNRRLSSIESDIGSIEHVVAGYGRRLGWVEERLRAYSAKQTGKPYHPPDMDDGK